MRRGKAAETYALDAGFRAAADGDVGLPHCRIIRAEIAERLNARRRTR